MSLDKTISVGFVTGSMSRSAGGLFTSVRRSAQTLSRIGIAVEIYALIDEHSQKDLSAWAPLRPKLIQRIGPAALGFGSRLDEVLRAANHDVLHQQGIWQFFSRSTMAWRKRTGKVVVISPRGMLDPWAVRNSSWRKELVAALYENANLRGATCIHALCDAELLAVRGYGLKNPVAVIPNGVDLPDLDAGSLAPNWESRVSADAKVLFFLSRLHPKKGLVNLLDAWAQVRVGRGSMAAEWQLVIAGWGAAAHQAELERQAQQLGVKDSVHFVGPQFDAEKTASFRRADAFVLPSVSEGLPMAVLEAWSYELPVIMTPQCNLPIGFEVGAAIEVLPDKQSLFRGLVELFGMTDHERSCFGAKGRTLVERHFAWASIGERMAEVYRWTLGGGAMPASVDAYKSS